MVKAISNGIGTGQIKSIELDEVIDEDWTEYFNINIKMKTSPVMRDLEPPENSEDPEGDALAGKFPWHCEKGIIANIRSLNIEFNKFRGLNPVKIFVSGPPASGKSHFSEKLSHYYNVPHITVKQAVELIWNLPGEWAEGVRAKIDE